MSTTDNYNHAEYMEMVAIALKEIQHSPNAPRFFKSTGLASLDGLIASLGTAKFPAIIAEDQGDESLIDYKSDNLLAKPYYTFYVIYKARVNDDESIYLARKNAKAAAKKVLSLMHYHAMRYEYGLNNLDLGSVRIMGIGPLGDFGHGVQVSFTLLEEAGIVYNEEDWA